MEEYLGANMAWLIIDETLHVIAPHATFVSFKMAVTWPDPEDDDTMIVMPLNGSWRECCN